MAMGLCAINTANIILGYGNMLIVSLYGHVYLKLSILW